MLKRIKDWMQGVESGTDAGAVGAQVAAGGAALNILMVCSGNICRSPTAEGVLRAKLQRAGIKGVAVDSAGTHGYHVSEPPDPRAQAAAQRRGYDLSRLRARPVNDTDFQKFQWLLAMDQTHVAWLQQRLQQPPQSPVASDGFAASTSQVKLLLEHARRFKGVAEVPDPYYGSPAGFEHVLDLVEDACDGLVDALLRQQARR